VNNIQPQRALGKIEKACYNGWQAINGGDVSEQDKRRELMAISIITSIVTVVLVVYFILILVRRADQVVVCTRCESQGRSATRTKGSFAIELILWLLFIVPGLIYSIWRLSSRQTVCAVCQSESVVPISSPAGMKIINDARANINADKRHGSNQPTAGIKSENGINIIDID